MDLLGTAAGKVKAGARVVIGHDLFEYVRLPLKEVKLRDAVKVIGKAGSVRQKIDHAIGVGIGERLEQNRIHYREDGGVGSDTEGQRGYGGNGEAGILTQLAQAEARILPKQFQSGTVEARPEFHRCLDRLIVDAYVFARGFSHCA
jgi:hypothetical protein